MKACVQVACWDEKWAYKTEFLVVDKLEFYSETYSVCGKAVLRADRKVSYMVGWMDACWAFAMVGQ